MRNLFILAGLLFLVTFGYACEPEVSVADAVEQVWPADSIHPSGLAYAPGFAIVRGNCTTCHSAKLITQNRATREGWEEMIRWMQSTQGLHDLEDDEPIILDYLAENYAPKEIGRRKMLNYDEIDFYELNPED